MGQASFRGLGQLFGNTPFKRGSKGQMSLRINDLPSNKERKGGSLCDSPILEDVELPPSNLEDNSSVNAMCQQLNKGVDLLSNDDPFSLTSELATMSGTSGTSTPAMMAETSSNYSMSPPPSLLQPIKPTSSQKPRIVTTTHGIMFLINQNLLFLNPM